MRGAFTERWVPLASFTATALCRVRVLCGRPVLQIRWTGSATSTSGRCGDTVLDLALLDSVASGRLGADSDVRELSLGGRDHGAAPRPRLVPEEPVETTVERRDRCARTVVSELHSCLEILLPETELSPAPCRGETAAGWALRLPLSAGSAEEDLCLFPAVQRH